jgi:hypothetical protein
VRVEQPSLCHCCSKSTGMTRCPTGDCLSFEIRVVITNPYPSLHCLYIFIFSSVASWLISHTFFASLTESAVFFNLASGTWMLDRKRRTNEFKWRWKLVVKEEEAYIKPSFQGPILLKLFQRDHNYAPKVDFYICINETE